MIALFPTQLGFHFWLTESLVLGRRIDYLSPTLYLVDILLVCCVLVGTYVFGFGKGKVSWLFFLALTIGTASIAIGLFSNDLLIGYAGLRLMEWLFLAWIILQFQVSVWNALVSLGFGVFLTFGLSVAQFLSQHSLGGGWYFFGEREFGVSTPGISQLVSFGKLLLRPYATFPHPNVMGGYLLLVLTLFLFTPFPQRLLGDGKAKQMLFMFRHAVIAASSLGIWLSFSRTVWLLSTFVLIVYLFIRKKSVVLLAILIIGIGLAGEEAFIGRIGALFTTDQISLSDRVQLAQSAVRMWQTSPLIGVGALHFISKLPNFSSPPYLLQPVHSIYLLLLAETGIVGLGIFILLVYKALRQSWQHQPGVSMALSVAFCLGLFDHYLITLSQTQLLFVLILTLAFIPQSRYNR